MCIIKIRSGHVIIKSARSQEIKEELNWEALQQTKTKDKSIILIKAVNLTLQYLLE